MLTVWSKERGGVKKPGEKETVPGEKRDCVW